MAETANGQSLKFWHVIIVLAVQLVVVAFSAGVIYTQIRQELSDMESRLAHLENARLVSQDEFDSLRDELRQDFTLLEQSILGKQNK